MLDKNKIQRGDILLYKPKDKSDFIGDIIIFFSNGGPYTHGSIYIGDNKIIESHISTGVVEKELNPEYLPRIDVFRVNNGLDDLQRDRLISYMRTNEIGKGYDLAAFPSTWLRSSIAAIFGWRNFRKGRPILNDDSHRFCTELVACSYKNALGIYICDGLDPHSTTPNDIGRSKLVTRVS